MPIIGGPVEALLVAGALVVAVFAWAVRRRRHRGPRLVTADDGIDHEELEAAEREVRDLESGQRPEQGLEEDDWGPGAARRPRPPVRL